MVCFRTEERQTDLHQIPNIRTGKRVSFQSLSHAKAADRDRPRLVPHGEANKNLVPKSSNEMEKGE